MKKALLSVLSIGAVVATVCNPANATLLSFNFSGPSGTALFQLDSSPKPDYVNAFSFLPGSGQFGFNNVAGTYAGKAGVASTINFGAGIDASLNIVAPGLGFTQFSGPALFTGTFDAPTFLTGSFTLINPFFGNGALTISQAAGAVPEPATWTMMVIGIGLIGASVRYGRRRGTSLPA